MADRGDGIKMRYSKEPTSVDLKLVDYCETESSGIVASFIEEHYLFGKLPDYCDLILFCFKCGKLETAKYILNYCKRRKGLYPDKHLYNALEKDNYDFAEFIMEEDVDQNKLNLPLYYWRRIICQSCVRKEGLGLIKYIFENHGDKIKEITKKTKITYFCKIALRNNNPDTFKYFCEKIDVEEISNFVIEIFYTNAEKSLIEVFYKLLIENHAERIYTIDKYASAILSYGSSYFKLTNYIIENFLNKKKNTFLHITKANLFLLELEELNTEKWTDKSMIIDEYIIYYENPLKEEDKEEFMEAFGKHLSLFNRKSGRSNKL